jgi:hypothetical protein
MRYTNLELSIKLKKLGVTKPSRQYYEWTGSDKIEYATGYGYFVDNINCYTPTQMKRILPRNVAVNENVKEIGFQAGDSTADKLARLYIYLKKMGAI